MDEIITYKIPAVLPRGWRVFEESADGYKFANYDLRQTVIVTDALEQDGKRWRHFSMSCAGRVPNWDELKQAKEVFLGVETKAILVIPAKSEYVNINERVLHLFVCLENDPLPDFTRGGGTL